MERPFRRGKAKTPAKKFHISQDVSPAELPPLSGSEEQPVPVGSVPRQHPPEFKAEGDAPLLPSFAGHREQEIVHVAILYVQRQCLVYPATRIQQKQNNEMQPLLIRSSWLVSGQQTDLR
jgi:hypothetical protein